MTASVNVLSSRRDLQVMVHEIAIQHGASYKVTFKGRQTLFEFKDDVLATKIGKALTEKETFSEGNKGDQEGSDKPGWGEM